MASPTDNGSRKGHADQRHCPFISHPFPCCYCLEMDSGRISRVIDYCYDRYWNCPIYRREQARLLAEKDGLPSTPVE